METSLKINITIGNHLASAPNKITIRNESQLSAARKREINEDLLNKRKARTTSATKEGSICKQTHTTSTVFYSHVDHCH
ncbi:CLUMA_CG018868, isoform A [Clunio marinus]|uniref:CLUMA_CG018868, isoform A n=1 Tax=Clunio marinus TaxID=568069 RepID=A0A1J1J4P0_9DIPT|nr:CLUMA_CG018868, isoform A [Clunio marinus]